MKKNRGEWAIWIAVALQLAVTLALYAQLPLQVPLHWNLSGQIDRYGPRITALLPPLECLVLSLLLRFLPRIDPKRSNYEKFSGAYAAFRLAFALFFCLLQGVILYSAFHPEGLDVGRILTSAVGMFLCVIGNFMPKFKHNYFIGIRTPWTLASESVWYTTHRMAGPLWVAGGLFLFALGFLASSAVTYRLLLGVIAVLVAVPFLYSFLQYRREKPSGN